MKKLNFKMMMILSAMCVISFNSVAQFGGLKKLKDKVAGGGNKSKDMVFEKVWSTKTSSSATVYSCASPDGSYALTTSKTDMALIDGESGKQLWYGKFKEVTDKGITNSNYQFVLWEANTLLVFDSKVGKNDRIAGINLADGSLMWILDSYQIPKKTIEDLISYIPEMKAFAFSMPSKTIMVDVKSGEELWVTEDFKGAIGRHVYLPDTKELVVINFMRNEYDKLATGLSVENVNTIAKIDISNGDVVWKSNHKGFGGKKFITKERQGSMEVQNGKILVIYNGIQVFDLASGENVWDAYYNESIRILKQPSGVKSGLNAGLGKTGGLEGETYDAIAEPLITDEHVYVV
ncbi:MAG: PQQ-binding-like beta-propeller repeat protein, partial [Cyclobacteriaceae bacterium]